MSTSVPSPDCPLSSDQSSSDCSLHMDSKQMLQKNDANTKLFDSYGASDLLIDPLDNRCGMPDLALLPPLKLSGRRSSSATAAFTNEDLFKSGDTSVLDLLLSNSFLFSESRQGSRGTVNIAATSSNNKWESLYEEVMSSVPPPLSATPQPVMLEGEVAIPAVAQQLAAPASSPSEAAPRQPACHMTETVPTAQTAAITPSSSRRRRRPKRTRLTYEPESKEYVVVTDEDVLCGRGAKANNHKGNKLYLEKKDSMQAAYRAATKNEKMAHCQELVDYVHKRGGRFLKKENGNADLWYEVHIKTALCKAGQALRDVNTPKERARKRRMYPKGQKLRDANTP